MVENIKAFKNSLGVLFCCVNLFFVNVLGLYTILLSYMKYRTRSCVKMSLSLLRGGLASGLIM